MVQIKQKTESRTAEGKSGGLQHPQTVIVRQPPTSGSELFLAHSLGAEWFLAR